MENSEQIPPSRDEPKAERDIWVGESPKEFNRWLPKFKVELARALNVPPDDIDVTLLNGGKKQRPSETESS